MLWSLGKDSNVMVWLAKKAFFGRVPFPVVHVDTGKKFKEMYEFRARYAKVYGNAGSPGWRVLLRTVRCDALDALLPQSHSATEVFTEE